MMKSVTILVPCLNEEQTLPTLIERLDTVCARVAHYDVSYLFVDDGSSDGTLRILSEAQKTRPPGTIRIIELSRNFGKEAALSAGIDHINSDACIILDADLQDPPELIDDMLAGWEEGFDMVALKRSDRQSDTRIKRYSARLFYRIFNSLSDLKIPENVGDSRLIDRRVVAALKRLPENTRFMKGLFSWVGFKTKLVESRRDLRSSGRSKQHFWRLALLAVDGLTSFSPAMLRVWIYIGLLTAIYAFLHGLYLILRVMIVGIELPGYASLAVIMLFGAGMQMIGIGMIGEYVGRTFIESKRRPNYIIARIHE